MEIKIGKIYRLNNRYIEMVYFEDVFSKPVSFHNRLGIAGMMNTYVSIPLYNAQEAIGVIFEQNNDNAEKDIFRNNAEKIVSKVRIIGTYNPIKKNLKKGVDFYPTIDSEVYTIDKDKLYYIYNSLNKEDEPSLIVGSDIFVPELYIE